MTENGLKCFPKINKRSINLKRYWKNRTPEQAKAFSEMRSRVQTKVEANRSKASKKKQSDTLSKGMQKYWDSVDEERKKLHIQKMSKGMKEAWENSDENFKPLISLQEAHREMHSKVKFIDNLPRINDYCGVITSSEMAQL